MYNAVSQLELVALPLWQARAIIAGLRAVSDEGGVFDVVVNVGGFGQTDNILQRGLGSNRLSQPLTPVGVSSLSASRVWRNPSKVTKAWIVGHRASVCLAATPSVGGRSSVQFSASPVREAALTVGLAQPIVNALGSPASS